MSAGTYAQCRPEITSAAPTAEHPWVQITNPCSESADLGEVVLRWAGESANYGWGATKLSGVLGPGECVNVFDFEQPLFDGQSCAGGLALFGVLDDALTATPLQSVSYGEDACMLPWTFGVTDVDAASSDEHIAVTTFGWAVLPGAMPGACGKGPGQSLPVPPVITPACVDTDDITNPPSFCIAHPWGRPEVCGGGGAAAEHCEPVLDAIAGCGITICQYDACMAALQTAGCSETPASCVPIRDCMNDNAGAPGPGGIETALTL